VIATERGRADLSSTWALVPLRGLETAKTRLGGELDAEERLDLVTAMARRTLAATRDARAVAGTVLVTADPAAAELAAAYGAESLLQRIAGLNAAIREARARALDRGASAVVVLPIDLVAVSAAAIDEVITGAASHEPAANGLVVLVPDRHGSGTNVLLTSPPAVIDPAFGADSRAAHAALAAAAGAAYLELGGPLTFDVDTAEDLLAAEPPG
jgi:2-phospho-L-lactate/phosphoenolpyruvate guanylyltransferase